MKIYHIIEPYVNSWFQSTLLIPMDPSTFSGSVWGIVYYKFGGLSTFSDSFWIPRAVKMEDFPSSLRFGRWSLRSSVPLRKPWSAPGFTRNFPGHFEGPKHQQKGGFDMAEPIKHIGICILMYPLKCVWKWGLLVFCSLMMVVYGFFSLLSSCCICSGDLFGM